MARKGLVAQTTCEVPTAPIRESVIARAPLHVCCICRKIRDDTGSSPEREHWVRERTYRQTHGEKLADFPLTHTYCPKCYTKFMGTLRQYVREHGTPP